MTCCKYSAGMLKTSVSFERKTLTPNGSGGHTETWASISGAQTKCAFKAMSGFERFASERTEARSKNRITCRYFSGLTESDRVVIGERSYNITFINNVEMGDKWLEIDISGGVAT